MGSILHPHQIPKVGENTMFASMYSAYDQLSDPIKLFISNLYAWYESIGLPCDRLNHAGALRDGENSYPEA